MSAQAVVTEAITGHTGYESDVVVTMATFRITYKDGRIEDVISDRGVEEISRDVWCFYNPGSVVATVQRSEVATVKRVG